MVDRTLYRPREIIQFCNDVKTVAVNLEATAPLNYEVISEAEHSYSEERMKDIASEYRFQYPGLLSVFETFRGRPYNYTRDALDFHCLSIATGDTHVDEAARQWCIDQNPDRIIEVLWRIGFLRAQTVGGIRARQRSGSMYLGSHQIANLNLHTLTRFHVHPMYRSALGLKEATAT